MKRTTLLLLSLLFVYGLNAQDLSLEDFVNTLTTASVKSSKKSKTPISVNYEFVEHTFKDYKVFYIDEQNYSITAHENQYELNVIRKNGKIRGNVFDHTQAFGYSLRFDSTLQHHKIDTKEIVYVCTSNETHEHTSDEDHHHKHEVDHEFGNSNQVTNPLDLESKPGATNIIYIDYDGEAELPGWDHYHYVASDGKVPDHEKIKIWESIAEDFIQFDVNITNNRALFEDYPELNRHMLIVAQFGEPGWRGIAGLESFGTGKPSFMDVPPNYLDDYSYLYRTGSHEIGHTLGLNHDGGSTGAYYSGHGEYTPIMGNGDRAVALWSNGDYTSATNFEDDIKIIGDWLGYNEDDYTTQEPLSVNGIVVSPDDNHGIIERRNDTDTFRIELTEYGSILLTVSSPIGNRTNLDINLQLLASDKSTVLATSQPIGDRNGYIDETLSPDTYYLVIDGGSELTASTGFSDYGSLGYYEISGYVGYIPPSCDFASDRKSLCLDEKLIIQNTSFGTQLQYEWTINGQTNIVSTDKNPSLSFTEAGNQWVTLSLSNNSGQSSCSTYVKVGNQTIRLALPKGKINEDLEVQIKEGNHVLQHIHYTDLIETDDSLYYNFCLDAACYNINMTNIFEIETCGFTAWNSRKPYTGGSKVVYLGKIYKAKWWTKGDLPTNSDSPWTQEGTCEITDNETILSLKNLSDGKLLFETTPLAVGLDLAINGNFCVGEIPMIEVLTTSPTTCGDVIFQTSSHVEGANLSWDFGPHASPATALGKGPHYIQYSAQGQPTISLDVDGVTESTSIQVVDGALNATLSISSSSSSICLNDEVTFTSAGEHHGNGIVQWFVNNELQEAGSQFSSSSWQQGDQVQARVTSDVTCVQEKDITSNSVTMQVDNCNTGPMINVLTTSPNNCDVVMIGVTSGTVGTTFTWDFGPQASPTSAAGKGPHQIQFSQSGNESISLDVDGDTESKIIEIAQTLVTPSVMISTADNESCLGTSITFSSDVTHASTSNIQWYLNNSETMTGDVFTSSTFTNEDVVYATLQTDDICVTSSSAQSNSVTLSLENCTTTQTEENKSSLLEVYPNPVQTQLNIKGKGIQQVQLFSLSGQRLHSYIPIVESLVLDIHELPTGVYFISIETISGTFVRKIIKM